MNSLKKLAKEYFSSFSQDKCDEFYNDVLTKDIEPDYVEYTPTDVAIDIRIYNEYKEFLKDSDLDESDFEGV